MVVVPSDWWKLVEGYRENPMDDLARCVSGKHILLVKEATRSVQNSRVHGCCTYRLY